MQDFEETTSGTVCAYLRESLRMSGGIIPEHPVIQGGDAKLEFIVCGLVFTDGIHLDHHKLQFLQQIGDGLGEGGLLFRGQDPGIIAMFTGVLVAPGSATPVPKMLFHNIYLLTLTT
jgi:hypothetical protein